MKIDFNKTVGTIKKLHGVNDAPIYCIDCSYLKFLKDAGIPYCRTHDLSITVGGMVQAHVFDVPLIFTDFDADPEDPAAYDFAFTDVLMKGIVENGMEPYFRLGVSIENFVEIKPYNVFPPKDNLKWAKICEGIIRHYTEGWADGFYYEINYWEIWNEPDAFREIEKNMMWQGTKEQYYELYGVASKYLKNRFPHLKIGGYASCGAPAIIDKKYYVADRSGYWYEFLIGFMDYVKENNCPLDFFSWHAYLPVHFVGEMARATRKLLDSRGFTETESSLNEWNINWTDRGTVHHANEIYSILVAMQDMPIDNAMFYCAAMDTGMYSNVINSYTREPLPEYYALFAFNELYKLENQVEVTGVPFEKFYAVASAKDGKGVALISNPSDEDIDIELEANGEIESVTYLDDDHLFTEDEFKPILKANCSMMIKYNI